MGEKGQRIDDEKSSIFTCTCNGRVLRGDAVANRSYLGKGVAHERFRTEHPVAPVALIEL